MTTRATTVPEWSESELRLKIAIELYARARGISIDDATENVKEAATIEHARHHLLRELKEVLEETDEVANPERYRALVTRYRRILNRWSVA